jgi:hypothetical protein
MKFQYCYVVFVCSSRLQGEVPDFGLPVFKVKDVCNKGAVMN